MFKRNNSGLVALIIIIIILLSLITVYATASAKEAMNVSAKAAVLYQPDTGRFLFTKNGDARLPMASTTKIMTALIAIENTQDLEEAVPIADEAIGIEGSSAYLNEGDVLTMRELLYALLLGSANDAATAIAYHIGADTEGFTKLMNARAQEIGLTETHFNNPHGLDSDEHYTTAEELAKLAAVALSNEIFREICSTYKKTITTEERQRTYINHNKLLNLYDGAIGVKTGYTQRCGRCLVGAAERGGVTLISVTLDAPNDWNDHERMLDYGFDTIEQITLAEVYEFSYDLPIKDSREQSIRVTNVDELTTIVDKGDRKVTHKVELPEGVSLPINEGDVMGKVIFYVDDVEIGSIELVSTENTDKKIERRGLLDRLRELLKI